MFHKIRSQHASVPSKSKQPQESDLISGAPAPTKILSEPWIVDTIRSVQVPGRWWLYTIDLDISDIFQLVARGGGGSWYILMMLPAISSSRTAFLLHIVLNIKTEGLELNPVHC